MKKDSMTLFFDDFWHMLAKKRTEPEEYNKYMKRFAINFNKHIPIYPIDMLVKIKKRMDFVTNEYIYYYGMRLDKISKENNTINQRGKKK